MKKYTLNCILAIKGERVKINLKNNSLYEIDKYTKDYENEKELKDDFKLSHPEIKPFFIDQGTCEIDENGIKSVDILYKNNTFNTIFNNIKLKEDTDEIIYNQELFNFILIFLVMLKKDGIEYAIKNNYITDEFLSSLEDYRKYIKVDKPSSDLKEIKKMKVFETVSNYSNFRKLAFLANERVNYKNDEKKEEMHR